MHTVDLYDSLKRFAETMGYQVREENLGGVGGGVCEIAGRKCVFVDLAMSSAERLDNMALALGQDPVIHTQVMPLELRELFGIRRAA